jgi:hypothetical protein
MPAQRRVYIEVLPLAEVQVGFSCMRRRGTPPYYVSDHKDPPSLLGPGGRALGPSHTSCSGGLPATLRMPPHAHPVWTRVPRILQRDGWIARRRLATALEFAARHM